MPDELVATLATVGDLHHYLTTIEPRRDVEPAATRRPVGPDRVSPLESSSIILRPVTGADEPYLFRLLTSGEQLVRYRLRGMTPSPEAFHQFIWDRVVAQFVAIQPPGPARSGWCRASTPTSATATPTSPRSPIPRSRATGSWPRPPSCSSATSSASSTCGSSTPSRSSRTTSSSPTAPARLFEVEGRLREHEYVGGRYVDALLLRRATGDQWTAMARSYRFREARIPGKLGTLLTAAGN